jgi:hypothetical protein
MRPVAAAFLLAALAASPGSAASPEQGRQAPVYDGFTAAEVAEAMARLGFAAEPGEDDGGPLVAAGIGDLRFVVLMFGCGAELPARCGQIQFRAAFADAARPASEIAAAWNLDRVFGRALADPEGRAVLEHPVHLAGGATAQLLFNNLALWENSLREFASRVGAAP